MKNRILLLIATMAFTLSSFAVSAETDRTWYLAGEAMTVSVTADSALIAYAELCDTHGLAASVVISLKEGKGTGVVELPSDLHSGYYLLSVYTRDNAQVSQSLVAVVNPLRKSKDDDIEWVEITSSDSLSYTATESEVRGCGGTGVREMSAAEVFVHETEGQIIKARVRNVYDGHTFEGSQICPSLSVVGKQIHYFEGKMVDDTLAVFYTYGISGKHPIVLSAIASGVSLPIEMISPFRTMLPNRLPHLVFHYQRREVEDRSLDMQRRMKAIIPEKTLDYDNTVFGTKPDLSYNLDEYRQFLTIREVLLEYVFCVMKKKINGVTQLFVRREMDHFNSSLPTLVLIDGMPANDIEQLLNYDARRIHYINIYGGQYTFGRDIYNGILSFVTRSGRLTNYPTGRNTQYLEYEFPQ